MPWKVKNDTPMGRITCNSSKSRTHPAFEASPSVAREVATARIVVVNGADYDPWAEKLLERAIEQSEVAKRKASETTKTQRILTIVAVVLGVGALVAWGLMGDIPLVPDP